MLTGVPIIAVKALSILELSMFICIPNILNTKSREGEVIWSIYGKFALQKLIYWNLGIDRKRGRGS